MPTNRKVIDFKIHNLTEEQFQELKEAGQIDPNAIYCTPDETVANFEAVNARIDETNKKLNTFESGVNETVGVINTTITNVDKKVDEAIQTEQQHNTEINARVDKTVANFEELNERIDTKQDVATAINYGHVTNCITEIPQDIKLELNNGVLTLKAGSKVYVPNGAGVFNEIVRDLDLVYNFGTPSNGQYLIFNSQYFYMLSNCVSGATDSKAGQGYHSWYDTTNNLVKQYWADGSTLAKTDSLPVAIVTISGGVITSIDQVFNGFGYIGSTVFALSGVKGLIPNGRNADGSLNNIEITTPTIKTMTMASYMAGRINAPLTVWANSDLGGMDINQNTWGTVKRLSDIVRPSYYACYYCLEDNLVHYFNSSGVESIRQSALIGSFNVGSDNKITQFTPKTAFHAVDYNDTEYMAHQAMPSDKYIDLTLGASGSTYQAPADGYFVLIKSADNTNQFITIFNLSNQLESKNRSGATTGGYSVFIPCQKGDTVQVDYTFGGDTNYFRFIYANGAK